ncbi:MAG: phage terminase large subunit, partial [Actinomycetota bacterium]|nr:phage terminase large subunit [Actinomycetota bacterium]
WTVLHLPALNDDGTALWPERFSTAELTETKAEIGSRNWEALYQGRPSPSEGGLLKREWWKFYREAPTVFDRLLTSWDMTFKETKEGSYVVGQVWGQREANYYLLDQMRARMDFPEAVFAVRALAAKWPAVREHVVEDKANGPAVIATLRNKIAGMIPVNPEGGKEARANAVSPMIEAGNVYLPDPLTAPWIHDFIEECAAFPMGANDDQVDAMSQALVRLRPRRKVTLQWIA